MYQRTQTINSLRSHLAEIGCVAPQGADHARALAEQLGDDEALIPLSVRVALAPLAKKLYQLVYQLDKAIQHCDQAKQLAAQDSYGNHTCIGGKACKRI